MLLIVLAGEGGSGALPGFVAVPLAGGGAALGEDPELEGLEGVVPALGDAPLEPAEVAGIDAAGTEAATIAALG